MAELESLLGADGSTSLDDLVATEQPTDKPIVNNSTANNMAAHAAMLAPPEDAVSSYKLIRQELGMNTPSLTMNGLLTEANKKEADLTKGTIVDILSDESVSIDEKFAVASQWKTNGFIEKSPEELVSIKSVEQDGQIVGNAEVEETRWDLLPHLQEVNRYNDRVQQMINTSELDDNPDALNSAADFLELIVPFAEGAAIAEIQNAVRDYRNEGKAGGIIRSMGALGESKAQIAELISSVPIEKRYELAKAVHDMVMASGGSVIQGKNSMVVADSLRNFLVEGHYTFGERMVDDAASLLDWFGVGSSLRTAKAALKGAKAAGAAKSAASAAKFTKRTPKALGSTLSDTNAKQFNGLLKAAADDETGEVARTVFNSSKEDAIINAVGPEIGNAEDVVRHKPLVDDAQLNPDVDVVKQIASGRGNIQFTEAEKASRLAVVSEDFLNPVGNVVARKEMTTIKAVDEGVNVRTIYGPTEGGWSDANEALSKVRLSTAKYGVSDEELTVLKRQPDGTYAPVEKTEIGPSTPTGNYVVSIDHTAKYDPSDTLNWSVTGVEGSFLGVPLNLFDYFPSFLKGKAGSITQHFIPSPSYVDPILGRAATISVDQAARSKDLLIGVASPYADMYKKLPSVEQKKFDNYLIKANHDSLKFDSLKLKADGFSDETIETIRQWKRTNDTIYALENIALVRESKRKGWMMFKTYDGDGGYLVKPVPVNQSGSITYAYDADTKTIRALDKQEVSDLYKADGYLAKARYPITVDGESIPHVIVRQNESNYARGLREDDRLLNYRDGHYTVYYKDPVFVTQKMKNADGSEYTRAVATAGSIEDAEAHIRELKRANPDGEFDFRYDVKGEELDDMMYNARATQGRTAWRTRGKLLDDASSRPTDPQFKHIATPEESLMRSIGSITTRVNMREFIDTAKARFTKQYSDYLPIKNHVPVWPDDVTQLRAPTGTKADLKDFADAKSTFRYIDQVENGFMNLIDDTSKVFFKTMADTAGRKGWGYLEKGARAAAEGAPTAFARKKAFRLSLAAAPIRQVLVQASQGLPIVLATNPKFVPKAIPQLSYLRYLDMGGDSASALTALGTKLLGLTAEEALSMEKAYQASGLANITSTHSYMRDQMKQLVARGPVARAKAIAGKPLDVLQRYGFETGENLLMKTIWLSEYDLLRRSGKKIDAAALDMLHVRVRDLTGNMNKAHELAYNENAFSALLQFMQAPHKTFSQIMLGHRGLSKVDRVKLGTSYLLVYGTGYNLVYDKVAQLIPEGHPELREAVAGGLFNAAMNNTLSTLYGEEVEVDFSGSFRLLEFPDVGNLWTNLATMNMEELLKKSPSGGLLLGDNGKLKNLIHSIGRVFTTPEDDGRFKDVGENFLHLYSGASQMLKARYIWRKGVAANTKGEIVDSDVNKMEAFMRIAGFTTVDEVMKYALDEKTYAKSKAAKDDVKYVIDETSRRLAREGLNEEELEFGVRLMQESMFAFNDNPYLMELVQKDLQRRLKSGDHILLNRLVEMSKISSPSEAMEMINRAPIDEETRRNLISVFKMIQERPEEE